MTKIQFEIGALLVGGIVWAGLGLGILLQNGFIIVISSLTLGLVISIWIVIIATNINAWNTKRKYGHVNGVNQIVNNYVSYVDLNALEVKSPNIGIGAQNEGKQ